MDEYDIGYVSVPYWEFYYRRDINDKGHRYVVFDKADIPPGMSQYATEGAMNVPAGAYYTKGFDITGFFAFWDKTRSRRLWRHS